MPTHLADEEGCHDAAISVTTLAIVAAESAQTAMRISAMAIWT
jgi:hypothetical protein